MTALKGKNQLVSSEEDGILTTRYRYGWLDKVVGVPKKVK